MLEFRLHRSLGDLTALQFTEQFEAGKLTFGLAQFLVEGPPWLKNLSTSDTLTGGQPTVQFITRRFPRERRDREMDPWWGLSKV